MYTGVFNRWNHESKATQGIQYRKEKSESGRFKSHMSIGINEVKEFQRSRDPKRFRTSEKDWLCVEKGK